MSHDFIKIINVCLELLIWVGLWGATENILSRYSLNKNTKLFTYLSIAAFAFFSIRMVNGELILRHTN